jgi:aryl-alcohol dehydrogenase-like predicted oxidoreductase
MLPHRQVGSSGLWVSTLAYGTGAPTTPIPREQAESCIRAALDAGVTTFDTADAYRSGRAESLLGQVLSGRPREQVVIMTKVGFPTLDGPNGFGLSRKHIRTSVEGSLRRLATDYIDLYQAHRPDPRTEIAETLHAFASLVEQGKILYIGVSEWAPEQIDAAQPIARQLGIPLAANQLQYSMLWRAPEPMAVPRCRQAGIGILAWAPLAQGVLSGKYRPATADPPGSRATDQFGSAYVNRYASQVVLDRIAQLSDLARDIGLTTAQLAIAWILSRPGVACAIAGGSQPEQVIENAAAAACELDHAVMQAIDDALDGLVELDPAKVGHPEQVMAQWRRAPPKDHLPHAGSCDASTP